MNKRKQSDILDENEIQKSSTTIYIPVKKKNLISTRLAIQDIQSNNKNVIPSQQAFNKVCFSVSTQTDKSNKGKHNIVKPFFQEQKDLRITDYNKKIVHDLINGFNAEIRKYNIFLSKAQIEELNDYGSQKSEIIYNRTSITKSIEELIYQSLYAKDSCNISDFHYNLFRKILDLPISNLFQVIQFRRQLDAKFALNKNCHGFYVDPLKKIIFVLKYYISSNNIKPGELIKIKLVGDGVNLSKKHTNLFNFAFTIIDEVKKNKSCEGNYILGKINVYLSEI